MIHITDGHIVKSSGFATPRELVEVEKWVQPLDIEKACWDAFCHRGRRVQWPSSPMSYGLHQDELGIVLFGMAKASERPPPRPTTCYCCALQPADTRLAIDTEEASSLNECRSETRLPPELFLEIALWIDTDTGQRTSHVSARTLARLAGVCCFWATMYRPLLWKQTIEINTKRDIRALALLLDEPPRCQFPAVASLIQRIVVNVSLDDHGLGMHAHLVPALMHANHSRTKTPFRYDLRLSGLASTSSTQQRESGSPTRMLHTPSPLWFAGCRRLELSHHTFSSLADYMRFLGNFRSLEELSCEHTLWLGQFEPRMPDHPRPSHLKHMVFDLAEDFKHWNHALWAAVASVRRKTAQIKGIRRDVVLQEEDCRLIMLMQNHWLGYRHMPPNSSGLLTLRVADLGRKDGEKVPAGMDFIVESSFCHSSLRYITSQCVNILYSVSAEDYHSRKNGIDFHAAHLRRVVFYEMGPYFFGKELLRMLVSSKLKEVVFAFDTQESLRSFVGMHRSSLDKMRESINVLCVRAESGWKGSVPSMQQRWCNVDSSTMDDTDMPITDMIPYVKARHGGSWPLPRWPS